MGTVPSPAAAIGDEELQIKLVFGRGIDVVEHGPGFLPATVAPAAALDKG
jgi:hypothetical protein